MEPSCTYAKRSLLCTRYVTMRTSYQHHHTVSGLSSGFAQTKREAELYPGVGFYDERITNPITFSQV